MLTFWRSTIALFAISVTSIVFFILVKMSIYDIKFIDNLPPKGIQDIPPSDTIIPNLFAQIPLPTTQPPPDRNLNNTNSLDNLPLNYQVSPQQCFDYAKNCRDIQCAFEEFNVVCNSNQNGPVCTCGIDKSSSASSIRPNAHFGFLSIFISFVISFYYYI